jgi:hypothetical protein
LLQLLEVAGSMPVDVVRWFQCLRCMISANFKQYECGRGAAYESKDAFSGIKDWGCGYGGGFGQFTGLMRGAGHCGRAGEDATRWHD